MSRRKQFPSYVLTSVLTEVLRTSEATHSAIATAAGIHPVIFSRVFRGTTFSTRLKKRIERVAAMLGIPVVRAVRRVR